MRIKSSCMSTVAIFPGIYSDAFHSFGGTDGKYHYNDTWSFNLQTRRWTELNCIGFIPSAREGHAAAIVGNVIYVFGGRGIDGKDLSDLAAFKISSQSYQNSSSLTCQRTKNGTNRSTMVHVPKYGTISQRTIRSCHGLDWDESVCCRWRIIFAFQGRRPEHHTRLGDQ